jgi:hypothetical protein
VRFLIEFFHNTFFGSFIYPKERISSVKNYIFGKKLNRPFIYKPIHVEKKPILPPPLALRQFVCANREKVFERVYEYWC